MEIKQIRHKGEPSLARALSLAVKGTPVDYDFGDGAVVEMRMRKAQPKPPQSKGDDKAT